MTLRFDPPAPGEWALDRSHYPQGATPISQWLLHEGMRDGLRRVFAELGVPADTMDTRFVHGYLYSRLRPLINGDKASKRLPPAPILKLATRLHPAFRARNATARATLRDRPSNKVVERWNRELRPELLAANRRFQEFDVAAAGEGELQAHITALLDQLRKSFELHFWLHGHDLGPLARYLHRCLEWGLKVEDVIAGLAGASPSTTRPAAMLAQLRRLIDAAGVRVDTLADVRKVSGEVAGLLNEYLAERGYVLATGYDLDSTTLIEMPDVIVSSIKAASARPSHSPDSLAGQLKSSLPAAHHAEFDMLLADARNVMDMRDDNGPLTVEWPMGLLRRALLAAGRRLVERGAVDDPTHLFELSHDEARNVFGPGLPSGAVLAQRTLERHARSVAKPPATLGDPEPEPSPDVLPPALAQLITMTQTAIRYMGMDARQTKVASHGMSGTGIGGQAYVGTARVADSAFDAIERLEPGDVLIVRATSPAFNAVLAIAGAVVTADGGALSHAAVLARELGIPAVVGARDAMSIPDGSTVSVDPETGTVCVLRT